MYLFELFLFLIQLLHKQLTALQSTVAEKNQLEIKSKANESELLLKVQAKDSEIEESNRKILSLKTRLI